MFLGYSLHNKGYICLSPTDKTNIKTNILRHVIFNEYVCPYFIPNNVFQYDTSITNLQFDNMLPLIVLQPVIGCTSYNYVIM